MCATFHEEGLNAIVIQIVDEMGKGGVASKDDASWIVTAPVAHIEAWMLALIGGMPHENGIVVGSKVVDKHSGECR